MSPMPLSKTLSNPMCHEKTETRKILLEVHITANAQKIRVFFCFGFVFVLKVVLIHHE